jgi:RNA polymerase sigma-B factor
MTPRTEAELAARFVGRSNDRTGANHRRRERDLVLQYQTNPSARHTVIEAFRPLAAGVARRYYRGEEPLEDLEQAALVGLIKALERFDPDRGSPFATYALPTMSGEVRRHYRDTGWSVHVPRGAQELAAKVAALERASDHRLTAEDCAQRLGISVEDVVTGRIAQRAMRADSLDRKQGLAGDQDRPAIDPAVVDPGYDQAERRVTLNSLTRSLSERDRKILTLRYAKDLSQEEIGKEVGVSQMHVSRILRRVLAQLEKAGNVSDNALA